MDKWYQKVCLDKGNPIHCGLRRNIPTYLSLFGPETPELFTEQHIYIWAQKKSLSCIIIWKIQFQSLNDLQVFSIPVILEVLTFFLACCILQDCIIYIIMHLWLLCVFVLISSWFVFGAKTIEMVPSLRLTHPHVDNYFSIDKGFFSLFACSFLKLTFGLFTQQWSFSQHFLPSSPNRHLQAQSMPRKWKLTLELV